MSGVETAVFANDVCGAPIPWNMCPPWHYFDGKLFHYKLLKANNNTPLIDMCDGQVIQKQISYLNELIKMMIMQRPVLRLKYSNTQFYYLLYKS